MPTRYLKPGIRDSDTMDKLSPTAEVLFYRLIVTVDDFGRYDARTTMIKSSCFPVKDSMTPKRCQEFLNELALFKLIDLYEVDGKPYLQMRKWDNKPRATVSAFPALADGCVQTYADARIPQDSAHTSTSRAGAHAPETETETETETVTKTETVTVDSGAAQTLLPHLPQFLGDANESEIPTKAVVLLASAWELPTAWGEDAEKLGFRPADILHQAEKYRQYWVSGKGAGKRRSLRGWRQSWSTWLGKAEQFRRSA